MSIPKPLVKIGIGCLVVLLTCFGGMGFWAWRIFGGTVNPSTDYAAEINALVEQEQKAFASEPDAWNDLQKLIDRSRTLHEATRAARTGEFANVLPDPSLLRESAPKGSDGNPAKPEELAAAMALLDDLRSKNIFAELDGLAPRRHIVRNLQANGQMMIEMLLPDLGSARQLARANAARYHIAVMKNDEREAVRAFESGLALGRFYMQQGILIDRLVGQAILSLHITAMFESVDKIKERETLRQMLEIVDRQTQVPPITLSFETERRSILDTIQWTFTDIGNGNGYLSPRNLTKMQSLTGSQLPAGQMFMAALMADRKDTTAVLNRHFDELTKYAALPRQARMKSAFQPDVEVEKLAQRYMMLKMLLPAFGSAIKSSDQGRMEVAAAKTVLGIEIWRRGHAGRAPEELTLLVPGILQELPKDSFSSKAFGYKLGPVESDGPPRTYVLYSFGSDGVDDGGVEMNSKDRYQVLTRIPPVTGYDFVVYPVTK